MVEKGSKEKTKKIVVAGDALRDHNIYQGVRDAPHMKSGQETIMLDGCGGACLFHSVISAVGQEKDQRITRLQSDIEKETDEKKKKDLQGKLNRLASFSFQATLMLGKDAHICDKHSYALWGVCKKESNSKQTVWRMEKLLGYGDKYSDKRPCEQHEQSEDAKNPHIAAFDDGALGFRFAMTEDKLKRTITDKTEFVLLKTSYPLARGGLWSQLTSRFCKKLIVVVSISDLRRQGVGVKTGLSWERAAAELVSELKTNAGVSDLLRCRHLIISFGSEGALWMVNGKKQEFHLIYDAAYLEREWGKKIEGEVYGYMSCFSSALAVYLSSDNGDKALLNGIKAGLSAMRALRIEGHGDATKQPGFPFSEVAGAIFDISHPYSSVAVPAKADHWSIISASYGEKQTPLYGLAKRVARFGEVALANMPYARFGKLFTVDRNEIESLRSIKLLIKNYSEKKKETKPLSIAVFGPPGSGKSFGIKQLSKDVLENAEILEFNLSQFPDPEQHPGHLTGAFHEVRDVVLKGKMPIVFWDEFDSSSLKWLQYLLAPMQDGTFREGQMNHPIGRCVLIFAGGTSWTMRGFVPDTASKTHEDFKMKKGPDFVSRLSGSLDVLGPNRMKTSGDEKGKLADVCFPIRRALIMRVALGLEGNQKMEIDSDVLNAFLEISEYKHGARSLEKLVQLSQRPGERVVRRSDLPPDDQISMLVDKDEFMKILDRDKAFRMNAEILAPYYHQFYRQDSKRKGETVKYDMDYDKLSDDIKSSNVAAARRIPEVLSHASLRLVSVEQPGAKAVTEKEISKIIEHYIELLAETEHNGWMEQKFDEGYKYGAIRDDEKKIHPALVPYNALSEENKAKDINSVVHYPEIVKMAGFKIVKMR